MSLPIRSAAPSIPGWLRVRDLKRQAILALLLPRFRPRLVHRAFRIIGGSFGTRELDGIDPAEIAGLVALGFQPDIFDARNLPRHFLDAVDGLLPVVIRHVVAKLVHHDVQHGFWLAEMVLHGGAARMQRARSDSRKEQRGPRRDLHNSFCEQPHRFLPMVPCRLSLDSVSKPRRAKQIRLSRKRRKFAKSLTYQPSARYSPKSPLPGEKWIGPAELRKDRRPSRTLGLASRASGWATCSALQPSSPK